MADDKYSFLVIKYPWPDTADDALRALKELSDDKVVKLRDAVAIRKTEKGKIKLHQTKDDSIGKGFVKGGVIGVLFAMLFGPVGWIAMGAAAGGLFAAFDRGIKQKLLKELGENMTASESAVAILVESADWPVAVERMKAHGFQGTLVVSEIVEQDEAEVDKLLADPEKVATAPDVLEIVAVAAVVESVADVEPEETVVVAAAAATTGGYSIAEIEGIGAAHAKALAAAGVKTTDDLLAGAGSPTGRAALARETGHRRGRPARVGQPGRPDAHPGRRVAVQRPARGRRRRLAGRARAPQRRQPGDDVRRGRGGQAGHRPARPGRVRGRRVDRGRGCHGQGRQPLTQHPQQRGAPVPARRVLDSGAAERRPAVS